MVIHLMDAVVEAYLRQSVGISANVADVEFAPPSSFSEAGLARPLVVVHLWSVTQDKRLRRGGLEDGIRESRPARRAPSPILAFRYFVTALAGEPRDEHELLGRLLLAVLATDRLADNLLPEQLRGTRIGIDLCDEEQDYPNNLWEPGKTRFGLGLCLSVPAEVGGWLERGAPVETLSVTTDLNRASDGQAQLASRSASADHPLRRRRAGSAIVMEGRFEGSKEHP